jgi:hypothetical protein
MKRYLLIILGLIAIQSVQTQSLINGQVKNAETLEPIQYVSVLLFSTLKGTTTDVNGEFSLEIPNYAAENIFTFQIVGYETVEMSLVKLMKDEVVFLQLDEQKIDEVTINPINAYAIVQKAIERIPENYYSPPIAQEVYYRQVLETNDDLSILEEGHFNIVNTFNRTKMPKSVSVKKARGYVDMSSYAALGKMVANNIEDDSIYVALSALSILEFNPDMDALRSDKEGIFGDNSLKYYNYKFVGMAIKNDRMLYMINFDQKEGKKKTLYQGVLFIDTASYAIVEIEANLSPLGIDFQKLLPLKVRLLAKIAGYTINIQDVSYQAKYTQFNRYWVVEHGGFQLKGSVAKRKGVTLNGSLKLDYFVHRNYPKGEFFNLRTKYEVIESDLKNFNEDYFFEEQVLPVLSNKVGNKLKQKLSKQ